MIFRGEINLANLINTEFSMQFTARPPGSIQVNLNLKGDGRLTTTIFSAKQHCNVGTMLQLLESTSQQCCNAVLR